MIGEKMNVVFFIIYTILFKCDLICTHHCMIIFRVSGWDFAVAIRDYETSEIKTYSILKTTNNKWFYSLCIKLNKMVISNGCIVLFLFDFFFLRSTKIIKFVGKIFSVVEWMVSTVFSIYLFVHFLLFSPDTRKHKYMFWNLLVV